MRILITRPIDDAKPLAEALRAAGHEVFLEPLIAIVPLAEAIPDLADIQALLFTSANGVRIFAAKSERRDLPVFCVGDGSAEAARREGFAEVKSAAGDVAALADLVIASLDPQSGPLFHGAGTDLAGDLAGRLERAGFSLRRQALYRAPLAERLSPETLENLAQGAIDAALFFSPRTARHFTTLWREAGSPALRGIEALGLSPAILREIADLGWARAESAERPDLAAMLALVDQARRRREGREKAMSDSASTPTETAPIALPAASLPATPPRRTGAIVAGLLAGAIAGGAIAASAPYWQSFLNLPPSAETERMARLESELTQAKDAIAKLATAKTEARLDELDRRWQAETAEIRDALSRLSAAMPAPADLAPLQSRLDGLDREVAKLADLAQGQKAEIDLAPLAAAIAQMKSALAEQEKRLGDLAPLASRLADLKIEIDSVSARLDGMAGEIAAARADFAKLGDAAGAIDRAAAFERRAAFLLGLGEMRSALAGSAPFRAEWDMLTRLGAEDTKIAADLAPILAPLADLADRPTPSLGELQRNLPARAIAQAAEAEAAGDALGQDSSWFNRVLGELAKGVTIRPVGEVEGSSPLARLARAEARLGAGDLAAAVAELQGLTDKPKAVAADWLRDAEARLARDAAERNLTKLAQDILAGGSLQP